MHFLRKLTLFSGLYTIALCTETIHKRDQPAYPRNIGYVIFPSYQPLDVFGPLDILTVLSWGRQLNLSLIAQTLDPITTAPQSAAMNKFNSTFSWTINSTHTFDTARNLDLDVLFVPGGLGTRAPNLNDTISFVRNAYPRLKTIVSVCTGAGILARAGVLDGRNATTNKRAWNSTVVLGPKTNWIAQARWVRDGNVWTTSGVAAGMDGTLGWISDVWGESVALGVADGIEYEWHRNSSWDPFAEKNGARDVPPVVS